MATGKGHKAFYEWYHQQEGERWEAIVSACSQPNVHYELTEGLLQAYWLDEASYLAAQWLEPQAGNRVVDLCSAPGGKLLSVVSLALQASIATSLTLTANELSSTRRQRLHRVIKDHLDADLAQGIEVTGYDAARWGQFRPDSAERIILDVPCSSERHLIQDPKYLDDWSPGRSSRLAQQAYAMLLSAAQTLVDGGMVVYSTCAIANGENDMVLSRVMDRLTSKNLGYVLEPALPTQPELVPDWAEKTEYGYRILPDRAEGRGPLFVSRLVKRCTT